MNSDALCAHTVITLGWIFCCECAYIYLIFSVYAPYIISAYVEGILYTDDLTLANCEFIHFVKVFFCMSSLSSANKTNAIRYF